MDIDSREVMHLCSWMPLSGSLACLDRGAAEEIGKMMDLREILLNRHQRLAYFWSWAAGGLNGLSGGPLSCDRWITWETDMSQ